jgi:hypothetical protein
MPYDYLGLCVLLSALVMKGCTQRQVLAIGLTYCLSPFGFRARPLAGRFLFRLPTHVYIFRLVLEDKIMSGDYIRLLSSRVGEIMRVCTFKGRIQH